MHRTEKAATKLRQNRENVLTRGEQVANKPCKTLVKPVTVKKKGQERENKTEAPGVLKCC